MYRRFFSHLVGNKGKPADTEKKQAPNIQFILTGLKSASPCGQKICGIYDKEKQYESGKNLDQQVDKIVVRLCGITS
jgi:hypothetical protein